MKVLYDFQNQVANKSKRNSEKLSDFLDRKGYPSVSPRDIPILRVELHKEEQDNNIVFRSDGVYLIRNGVEYRGYMYLKKYWINYNGEFKLPRFHITKCSTVLEIEKRIDFVWHNSNEAEILDRSTHQIYKANLDLCWNCQKESTAIIKTTQQFYEEIQLEHANKVLKKDMKLDINGYVLGEWQQISRRYKEKQNYTCEKCNIQMEGVDKRYIHTDHKNGDKTRNIESNFDCLCILCHCYKDELHRENFGKRRMKSELKSFVNKFRNRLTETNNQHLKKYDIDNTI